MKLVFTLLVSAHLPSRIEKLSRHLLYIFFFILAAMPQQAQATEGGISNHVPILYGDTAIAVAPEPGLYLRNDFHLYKAELSVNIGGAQLDYDMDVSMYYLSGVYFTDLKLFGGRYACGALVPYGEMRTRETVRVGGSFISDTRQDQVEFSDLVILPLALSWKKGNLHFVFSESVVVPTADYEAGELDNLGLNYYSFETDLAVTYFNQDNGRDLSILLGYIYNTENEDTDYHSGQEIHLDYMLNQWVSESVAIGIHGFFYRQITGDSGSGAILGDFKGRLSGIGPALFWQKKIMGLDIMTGFRWLHEFSGKNRFEGDHFCFTVSTFF